VLTKIRSRRRLSASKARVTPTYGTSMHAYLSLSLATAVHVGKVVMKEAR
jgi:hypothetical protein